MNAIDLLTKLVESLNNLLTSRQAKNVYLDSVVFAFAKDVYFDDVCTVTKCYSLKSILSTLDELIQLGPSWVHANLVRGDPDKGVIILEFGASVGNPQPTINVSYEDRYVIMDSASQAR